MGLRGALTLLICSLEEADDLPLALHHLDVEVDHSPAETAVRLGPRRSPGREKPGTPSLTAAG